MYFIQSSVVFCPSYCPCALELCFKGSKFATVGDLDLASFAQQHDQKCSSDLVL